MTIKTILTGTATAATLALTGPALAGEDDWDKDGDGKYSSMEFSEGMMSTGMFRKMDANEDGSIDEEEFNNASFSRYDRDGSGDIDEAEREDVDRDMEREED